MSATRIYCSVCRSNNSHNIARGKIGPESFRDIVVIARSGIDKFVCECIRCSNTWTSKSLEAKALFEANVAKANGT